MRFLLSALLLFACSAASAKHDEQEILTVRAAQAELHGRPSLGSTVTGLVRRGETVEVVRSSADRRWVQVEIGGGELAWIEARAVTASAVAPVPDREHTLRIPQRGSARDEDEPRPDEDAPPRREPVREARNDPPARREPVREVRNDPPPPVRRVSREPVREVRNDPPPAPVVRETAPTSGRPLRDIPAARPGQLFAAELDDERPPSGPVRAK
jgi:hypothetical protein